eukprot:scaffold5756_cov238-Chaetoceros_neogracile.AAC.1
MSATNSSKDSIDESQESCGKKTKRAVSSNRYDMDSSTMGGKIEAVGGGMVAEENYQVNANATMQKEESSATKMKARLNHSNIINRKRKVREDSTLSNQEKASKSKRKKKMCQAEDEMAKKDAKQNEKKKRKKERKASDSHPAVAAGTDVSDLIHHEANMDDGIDMHTMNTKAKSHDEKWNILFMELVEYKEKNGHCNFPTTNGSLGSWINRQRALFRSKKLKADRYEKLVGIGFVFEDAKVTIENVKWNTLFMELETYKETNGHCDCPTKNNGLLGVWTSNQRSLFKSKKLKADRHEKLVGIGFAFTDTKFAINNEKWNKCFMELVEYTQKNGHCNFPTTNGSLGSWINRQRALFISKKLKADRYEKLVGIGFAFENARFETKFGREQWNKCFMELVKYKQKNGHCNVPTKKNGSLGNWVSTQRAFFTSKKLKEDRHEKLVGIGFVFENARFETKSGREKWNTRFMELVKYKQTNGHCTVPRKNGSLGRWITLQRELFRSKKLKADRYEKLVGIGFAFKDTRAATERGIKWNTLFMELVEYKEKNGHFNFPTTNGSLGRWISRQRALFTSKKLKADRYEKLVGIGFAFENAKVATDNEKWNILFMELVEYKEKNGHCNFPTKNNGSLGYWIENQRLFFRCKKLETDRHKKLVGIGFAFEDAKLAIDNEKWNTRFMELV